MLNKFELIWKLGKWTTRLADNGYFAGLFLNGPRRELGMGMPPVFVILCVSVMIGLLVYGRVRGSLTFCYLSQSASRLFQVSISEREDRLLYKTDKRD